jgi:hypothetical protein
MPKIKISQIDFSNFTLAWEQITGKIFPAPVPHKHVSADITNLEAAQGMTGNDPITPGTKTKITYDSKGLVTIGASAATTDIAESANKRYVTDTQLANIHAVGSDNQDLSGLEPKQTGKSLSANDLTAGLKTSYDGAVTHAGSAHAPSGATVGADWNTNVTNKPTIPAAQVQTDWNAVAGMGVLLNKPTLTGYAPLASPTFTGVPLSTTPATRDNTTKIATTAFVLGESNVVCLTSNVTTSSVTAVTTGLTFPIAANEVFAVDVYGTCSKATSATGLKFAVTGPVSCAVKGFQLGGGATLAAALVPSLITTISTLGTVLATGTNIEVCFALHFRVVNGANAGSIVISFATVTSNVATVYAGTKMIYNRATQV